VSQDKFSGSDHEFSHDAVEKRLRAGRERMKQTCETRQQKGQKWSKPKKGKKLDTQLFPKRKKMYHL